jgi:class 3 adenylate cyclase
MPNRRSRAATGGISKGIADHIANTSGDGLLIEFGVALGVLECAVQASEETGDSRLRLRVGVHLGQVLVRAGSVVDAEIGRTRGQVGHTPRP